MKKVDQWFSYFLNEAYRIPTQGLALYRICYAGFFLIFGLPTFSWISKYPDIFFNPPFHSLAAYFSGFPPYDFLIALDVVIALLFIFLLFGYQTKLVSILITLLWIVGNSFKYSFGKIDHNIIPVVIPFIMAFSGWGEMFSVDSQKNNTSSTNVSTNSGIPITLVAVILAFGFFTAGFPKLLHWIDFDLSTQGVRSWVIRGYYEVGNNAFLLPVFAKINNVLFWEVLDIAGVIFELGFFISVFRPSVFKIFVGLAVLFHFNNLIMLNISFSSHLVVYLLFIDWSIPEKWFEKDKFNKIFTLNKLIITCFVYIIGLSVFKIFNTKFVAANFSSFRLFLSLFTGNSYLAAQFILLFAAALILLCIGYKTLTKRLSRKKIPNN